MAKVKHEHVLGAAGLVIGLASVAVGVIALTWDRRRDQHLGIGEGPKPPRAPVLPVPPAQAAPVAPPTPSRVKDIQRWLNIIAGKKILDENGSAGPATFKAVQEFQTRHGMVATGKLDGMTQSKIANEAAYESHGQMSPEGMPTFAFRIVWDAQKKVWTSQDSLRFVTEISGHTDRTHPPTDAEVAAVLVKHYGAPSSVGKAIAAHRYEWTLDTTGLP